jgi:hypothetical protein
MRKAICLSIKCLFCAFLPRGNFEVEKFLKNNIDKEKCL